MIEAHALHRLISSIIKSLNASDLHEMAKVSNLDLQDEATLFRVASGEGPFSPVIQHSVVQPAPKVPWTINQPLSVS